MDRNVRYDRLVLLMTDDELEKFCRDWVLKKAGYIEVKRYAGAGDQGRDVVGFHSAKRHEGEWDNYQCKQYLHGVPYAQGLLAIGKVLYWASQGEFLAPTRFYFVAPRGVVGKLQALIDKPNELKAALKKDWDSTCAKSITKKQTIPLDVTVEAVIDAFDFGKVYVVTLDEMMADPAVIPLLVEKWGADPGAYPAASVPVRVLGLEARYVTELIEAYSERASRIFADHEDVLQHADYGPNLRMQRERFFDADAFQKFYRDNTSATILSSFKKDIQFGIAERWSAPAADILARIEAVMERAGSIAPAGPLAKYAHVPVKQGMCHHFVNDGERTWKT